MTSVFVGPVRVRIRKIPPGMLEGWDLRPYEFREGKAYEIGPRLAELLIVCGYADLEAASPRDQAADRDRAK